MIWQIYDYTFLSDLLEMIRGTCCVINNDKKLNSLFMPLLDYINSCVPDIEGEISDFDLTVT